MARSRAGFTLIEVLAVIVIMLILAAILLPVLGRAREQSHRTQCMANLHQIAVALKLYKLDQRGFPPGLDEVPVASGDRWFGSQDSTTGLPDRLRPGYGIAAVFPDYIESVGVFSCPNNDVDIVVDRVDPSGNVTATAGAATYNSYDGIDPLLHTAAASNNEKLKYRRFWRDPPKQGDPPDPQYRRQLAWRYPPEDTVVTWCVYHRIIGDPADANAGNASSQQKSWDVVLYLDGTTKTKPSIAESGHTSVPGDGS